MTAVRAVIAPPGRFLARRVVRFRTRGWSPASRLFAVGERTGWSVDEDARHLEATARRLGYKVGPAPWARFALGQAVFLTSHFEALSPRWLESSHRLATAYMHGRPGTRGYPEFDVSYETLHRFPHRFDRIQVTHREMHELVLSAGVDQARVFRIPIGVDLEQMTLVDRERRTAARRSLGLPTDAFVVGSFQKDGVGWDEGLEPKLIKGPDVLVETLGRVHEGAPELFVLLTGPARGYVRSALERLDIPYRHVLAEGRAALARAYHALDVYLVTSRQEGGPKAVLESFACGIPLVSTRVGQATEIVGDGASGLLADVEDVDALAAHVSLLREDAELGARLSAYGRRVAEAHAFERLDPAWNGLLSGFVVRSEADGR